MGLFFKTGNYKGSKVYSGADSAGFVWGNLSRIKKQTMVCKSGAVAGLCPSAVGLQCWIVNDDLLR